MSLPAVTVEFAFGQSIGTASLTWTDVTQYVRAVDGLSFNRTRNGVDDQPQSGSMSLGLANGDGRFTPGKTGGPYGDGVVSRIPVRVTANAGSGDRNLWHGFVTDIQWVPGGEFRARVQAADIVSRAAKTRCGAWYTAQHLATNPSHYWPMDDTDEVAYETEGTPKAVDRVGGRTLVGGKIDLYPQTESDLDDSTVFAAAPEQASNATKDDWLHGTLPTTATLQSFSVWFMPTGAQDEDGESTTILEVRHQSNQTTRLWTYWSGETAFPHVSTGLGAKKWSLGDWRDFDFSVPGGNGGVPRHEWVDTWHHALIRIDYTQHDTANPMWRVWLDGVEMTPEAYTYQTYPSPGNSVDLVLGGGNLYYAHRGQIAHAAAWFGTEPGDTAAIGADPATVSALFTNLSVFLPSAWLATDTNAKQQPTLIPTKEKSVLTVATQAAQVERGSIIAGRDGRLTLQSAVARHRTTPAVTLDARTDVAGFAGAFGVTDEDAWDEVRVTAQPSGVEYTGTRQGGGSAESYSLELWSDSKTHTESVASGLANLPVDSAKAPNVTLSMSWAGSQGFADDLLTLELGDLIRITNLPTSAPAATIDLIVEGIAHSIGTGDWVVELITSPGEAAAGAVTGTATTVATTLKVTQ